MSWSTSRSSRGCCRSPVGTHFWAPRRPGRRDTASLTLAVILTEVTDDAKAMLPMMFVLTAAKIVGDMISPSFDHAMMHLWELPFLDEEPLHEFHHLIARDVMRSQVYVLPERMLVGNLVRVLKGTPFHGFPIISVDGLNEDPPRPYFAGFIQRRQLLIMLQERVWDLPPGASLPAEGVKRFVDSAFTSRAELKAIEQMTLSKRDKESQVDFRPYMDPSPYVVSDLMPLRRVYRFFNEIGVRHLTVIDCREEVVGIITRKDIIAETIEETWYQKGQKLVEQLAGNSGTTRRPSQMRRSGTVNIGGITRDIAAAASSPEAIDSATAANPTRRAAELPVSIRNDPDNPRCSSCDAAASPRPRRRPCSLATISPASTAAAAPDRAAPWWRSGEGGGTRTRERRATHRAARGRALLLEAHPALFGVLPQRRPEAARVACEGPSFLRPAREMEIGGGEGAARRPLPLSPTCTP